jgi:putative GTP pyrophosphokinase
VSVTAGTLELIDREFDNIASEVQKYATAVEQKAESGDLEVPIDSTSLMAYLRTKFASIVGARLVPTFNNRDQDLIEELHDLGINTLAELDKVIRPDLIVFESKYQSGQTFAGLLRDIMIIHDPDSYFSKAWKSHWFGLGDNETPNIFKQYGIDIEKYLQKYKARHIDAHHKARKQVD